MDFFDYFKLVGYVQKNHFFLFFCCAILSTLIGISLSYNDSKRLNYIRFIHLVPLFLSPVLTSKILIDSLSLYINTIRANHVVLVIFGILFHSWFAYFLLTRIFNLQKQMHEFSFVFKSSRNLSLNPSYILELFLLKFSRPFIMTVAIIHVFFESMISLGTFTNTGVYTITFTFVDYLSEYTVNWPVKILMTITTIGLFISYIIISYFVSRIIEVQAKKKFSKLSVLHNKRSTKWNATSFLKFLNIVFNILRYASLCFQLIVIFLVLKEIFSILIDFHFDQVIIYNSIKMISVTLFSDAIKIGFLTIVIFNIWLLFKISSIGIINKLFRYNDQLLLGAIIPPVYYGICGLAISFSRTTLGMTKYISLILYSFLLFLFFSEWNKLIMQQSLFINAKRTQQSLKNRFYLMLGSHAYNFITAFIFASYFLWTEDGIQYYLGRNSNILSSNIKGLTTSALTNEIVFGLLIVFLFVVILLTLVKELGIRRFVFINKSLSSKLILCLLITLFISNAFAQEKPKREHKTINLNCKEITPKITVSECIVFNIKENCNYQIDSLIFDSNKGDIKLDCGLNSSLLINKLILKGNNALINISGLSQNTLQFLSINNVVLEDYYSPMIKISSLNLRKFSIQNILRDNNSSRLSMIFNESAVVNDLVILNSNLKLLSFYMPNGGTANLSHNEMSDLTINGHFNSNLSSQGCRLLMQEIKFVPNYEGQESNLKLNNINLNETNIQIRNNKYDQKTLNVHLKNCRLNSELNSPEKTNHNIVIKNIQTTLDLENIIINGGININIDKIEDLSFSNIKHDENQDGDIICEINSSNDEFPKIGLSKVEVTNLTICVGGEGMVNANFRHVGVKEDLMISENILESMNSADKPSYMRNEFFSLLKSNGRICGKPQDMGLDALYKKKKAELVNNNKPVAYFIDFLTGFGIRIWRPIISFLVYSIAFLIIIMCLVTSENKFFRLKLAFLYMVDFPPKTEGEKNLRKIEFACHFYHMLIFVQITMLSIYLGQITLQ